MSTVFFIHHCCRNVSPLPPRVAFGNSNGLAVVDYVQKTVVLNLGTAELYGPSDPHQRQPRSPRKSRHPSGGKKESQTYEKWTQISMCLYSWSPVRHQLPNWSVNPSSWKLCVTPIHLIPLIPVTQSSAAASEHSLSVLPPCGR